MLHYCSTERDDSDFWNDCRSLEPPTRLAEKIEIFERTGRVVREQNELFSETSWVAVMVGQGIEAGAYHPAADILSDEETLDRLRHIREVIANTAARLPAHREYIAEFTGVVPTLLRASL